ncbi:MAG TPA: gamma-glutamyltransferase family protein, partial [Gammaproteobacteria bacterium]
LRKSPAAAKVFLQNNEVPEKDFIIRQEDLAGTLEAIANKGAAGFYQGSLAKQLIKGVNRAGGIWSLQDLKDYRVIEREPLVSEYRGMTLTSVAPPSSGGVAMIEILNQLSNWKLEALPQSQRVHLIVEAMRRAYRDRAEYLGDSDFVAMPINRLTHPMYAAGLAATIHPDKATPSASLPGVISAEVGQDTTHFSVIDHEGNRVAATLSINYPFGSCFVPPGTGVLLNDEMDDFSSKPGVPNVYGLVGNEANAIEPGKRMLSSMSPTFLETEDRIAVIGTPGGSRIITMVLLGALEFFNGANADAIVNLPRFHHQYLPDMIFYEPDAFDPELQHALEQKGHQLQQGDRSWGNMQVVILDKGSSKIDAAADARGLGSASIID